MKRLWTWLGFAALVASMAWSILDEDGPRPMIERSREAAPEMKPIARSTATLAESAAKTEAMKNAALTAPPVPAEKQWDEKPFHYQSDLDAFARIKAKVFLSEEEHAELSRLLNDGSLLRALGLRLTEASLAPSVTASQDAAVDLLIEALKSGDKNLASQVAKAVIEDPTVENAGTERSVRENLAGIKAEVLYRWAAMVPEEASSIERYLPGPVSKKIWANVIRRHNSNQAESQEEL